MSDPTSTTPAVTSPLTDVLPPKARLYVYAGLTLGSLALSAYKAANGDWLEFSTSLLTALGFGTAASNVTSILGKA